MKYVDIYIQQYIYIYIYDTIMDVANDDRGKVPCTVTWSQNVGWLTVISIA